MPHGGTGWEDWDENDNSKYDLKDIEKEAVKKLYMETKISCKNIRYVRSYLYRENSGFVRKNIENDENWMHYYNPLFISDYVSDEGEGNGSEDWFWISVEDMLKDNTCKIKSVIIDALKKFNYIR